MKNVILTLTLILSSVSTFAASSAVVLKIQTAVGFAPPEYTGVYTTQVEANGTIRYIDNKKKETVIAKLSIAAVENLKKQVEAVQEGELKGDDSPMCMDAPTTTASVVQSSGKEIKISQNYGCLDHKLQSAYQLISLSEHIAGLVSAFKR